MRGRYQVPDRPPKTRQTVQSGVKFVTERKGRLVGGAQAGGLFGRQIDGENAAFARHRLDLQAAAVAVDHVLDDGEAEAGAAEIARARRVDAIDALGQPWKMLARDAFAAAG